MAKKIKGEDGKVYVQKKPFYKRFWFWVLVVIVIFGASSALGGGSSDSSKSSSSEKSSKTAEKSSSSKASSSKKSNVPTEYTSALNKAKEYASTMDMSKQGVQEQLTSKSGEGFSEKAAQYAMSNLTNVNWNKNALNKAKSYASSMDMSKQGIEDQLTSSSGEKFTEAQAQYAVNHLTGVNWNKSALNKAKSYQKEQSMSKSSIREQLTSSSGEQFTAAQADYAINHLK
ncbi:Ltp family lipoprotein [Pediococcus inopinatus]|uniref:Ltp family lipoprotein n=1 Tax=Pediococcus inopinatus TaxID=114090 RepID=UPI002A6A0FB0|nr:Ltp family lipoprotein [Pediococcus inopinatus]WPP08553.1 Ltp family lipoprotein [Pediococcus inopinatus]